jgi:hypothetical protein
MLKLTIIALLLALSGCATPSQWMVNNQGQHVRCAATGFGVIGMIAAKGMERSCVADYRKVGYREMADPE